MSTHHDLHPAEERVPVRVAHLVFGIVYLGIAGIWALATAGSVDTHTSRYLFPGLLVIAGGVGLVGSLASARRRRAWRASSQRLAIRPEDASVQASSEQAPPEQAPDARTDDTALVSDEHTAVIPTEPTSTTTDPEEGSR